MKKLKEQAYKITSLEIQGATNIARYGIKILKEFAERHKDLPPKELWKQILEAEEIIFKSRRTEPAMRNGLKYIINRLSNDYYKFGEQVDFAAQLAEYADTYLDLLDKSKKLIIKIGAKRIPYKDDPKDFTIFTHCHSSVTTGILKEAWKQGKRFNVICTETRPKYQGRITAKELLDAGIPTRMVVDSAMRWAVRNFDIGMIITGADAITSEGTVLNKIGSRLLALVAREMHIPYYVATPLLKFNPDTAFGNLEKIDMRPYDEVWPDKPEQLEILNPAFETVSRRYIDGLITEAGIFPATVVSRVFYAQYPFLKPKIELDEENGDVTFIL
ncbi:MAG: translation initiation factor eIF-2B [Promethearchaeota archaeon]